MAKPIKPFWEIIPQIFRYPAHASSLTTIALFSLLWLLSFLPGLIGLLAALLMAAATYKFAYAVLVHTARGNLEPPEGYFAQVDDGVYWQQIGLWLLMFLIWIGVAMLTGSPTVTITLAVFMLVALPIATMVLAIDQSVLHALNPVTWLDGMRRIGWPYVLVVVFLLMMIASSYTARAFVAPMLPFLLGYVAFQFIAMYFLVAMFFLMGYVIYQYHEELGFEIDEYAGGRLPDPRANDPILDRAQGLIEEGKPEDAKKVLKDALRSAGPLSEASKLYQRLCRITGDGAALKEFGRGQVTALLELGRDKDALELARECLETDASFQLADGRQVARLAELANTYGQYQLALKLTNGFGKRYPNHPDIPRVYLLAARVLSDKLGKDDQALAIVRQLERKYAQHELAPEIGKLRQMLDAISGGPAPGRA